MNRLIKYGMGEHVCLVTLVNYLCKEQLKIVHKLGFKSLNLNLHIQVTSLNKVQQKLQNVNKC